MQDPLPDLGGASSNEHSISPLSPPPFSPPLQCYICAGVASNRWVVLERLVGFEVGVGMREIGVLDDAVGKLDNDSVCSLLRDRAVTRMEVGKKSSGGKQGALVFEQDILLPPLSPL